MSGGMGHGGSIHRDQINLPPLNANTTPMVRYIHVGADESETEFP
jgi:hypothetical protein